MHVYFSGIGGVAIGPLARIARDLGYEVTGSDIAASRYTDSIIASGIQVNIGQNIDGISEIHDRHPIDWFVYTSGLPNDHPELLFAKQNGIKTTKRDVFITQLLKDKNLKLIAIAGTHGKTNTTGMLIWMFKQLGIPCSYSVGTNISFGENGKFEEQSEYFIYEADEFDRNFLQFHPFATIYTAVDYDHPETYPTVEDYKRAFKQFADLSDSVVTWRSIAEYVGVSDDYTRHIVNDFNSDTNPSSQIELIGEYNRRNAFLALTLMKQLFPELTHDKLLEIISSFPGTERRMEELADNLYSDYAHHPIEIRAALDAINELGKEVIVIYQPHQNIRQHQSQDYYQDVFDVVEKVYWLPTYLSREDPSLELLTPQHLISKLNDPSKAQIAEMNETLIELIQEARDKDKIVIMLSAGSLDEWARAHISGLKPTS